MHALCNTRNPMPPANNSALRLLRSFKGLGLTPAQVRRLMPEWWDDEAAEDEGGLLEMQILLARRLSVSLASLQSQAPQPVFRETTQRFKTVHPEGSTQLAVAASIGHGLAQLLASVCDTPFIGRRSAAELRQQLLGDGGSAVTLAGLCTWMWKNGLPVVHVTGWPDGLRRPDAMCVRVGDCPVTMVVRKELHPPKLAYLVAHELGHIMSGHLDAAKNAVLVDDTLPVDEQQSFNDTDEIAADAFAMTALGGSALLALCRSLVGPSYSELTLAVAALRAAKGTEMEPGQVILGWGRLTENWKLTNMALKYLQTTQTAPMVINDVANLYIDSSALSADGRDHLERLTAMELRA